MSAFKCHEITVRGGQEGASPGWYRWSPGQNVQSLIVGILRQQENMNL